MSYFTEDEYNQLMNNTDLTLKQKEAVEAVNTYGTQKEAYLALGLPQSTFRNRLASAEAKLAKKGFGHGGGRINSLVPEGFAVKGCSTLTTNANGENVWVKTQADQELMYLRMRQAFEALVDETIIPTKEIKLKTKKQLSPSLMNQFIFTDYHIGMLAWHEEGGSNWNIKIAETLLIEALMDLVERSPDAEEAILVLLGDFLHFDGMLPITPAHGHVLDADSRYNLLVRTAMRCIRECVRLLLQKHKKVTLLVCTGNHDESSTVALREAFHMYYDNNPRVNVITEPTPFYAVQHGDTGLFYHHGHKAKFDKMPLRFMTVKHEVFSKTHKWYGHCGHWHSAKRSGLEEYNGFIMEQHDTLSALDAFASHMALMSQRRTSCITYHKEIGEYSRIYTTPHILVSN